MVTLATRTLEMLAAQLPDATRNKAATLVAHRRVKDVVSTSSSIFATVQGSQPYNVEILELEDDEGVDVFCSCPAYYKYGPCKHVYATALEAVARADPGSRRGSRSGTHWGTRLRRVRHTEAEVDGPPPRRRPRVPVLYRVSVSSWSDERPIEIACVEQAEFDRVQRTRSRWRDPAPPRATSPTKLLRTGAANRLELRVLRELSLLEDHDRAFGPKKIDVPPHRVRQLLRLLARTSSAFVVVSETRVARLEDDSAVPYLVDFARHEDDSVVHVDAELTRGDERVSPREALLLLADGTLLHGGRLCRVAWRDPEESAWLSEILADGAMAVPVAELDRFEGEVLLGGYFPAAVLPDIDVERDVPPQPLLVVHARRGRAHPRADVHFEYGPVRVAHRDTTRVALGEDDVRLIWRRIDEERRHFAELFRLPHVSPTKNDPAHDVRIAPSQLPDAVLSLLEAGWAVEVEGRRAFSVSTSSVRVSSGQDWFDVEGIVDFDGVEVPLPDVVASTKGKDRFVRLENGGIGIVPSTFDDGWGLLEHLGRRQGNGLRFARSQGWLIDALLSARGDVRGDAGYEALRGGIAEFDGIADHEEPPGFQGTLRPYQRRALGWFAFLRRFGLGGCLADDMGLGKTIQVLALLVERKNAGIEAPSLVVAPRSVVHNWVREAARFAPGLRVVEYGGAERAGLLAQPRDVDLIATSYGVLRRDAEPLAEVAFDYVVLDEAQMVKNPSSRGSKAARTLTAAHRLALTGTPVENRLTDLWAILEFACPGLLGSSSAFRGLVKATTVDHEQRAALAAAIRPVLLRRTKEMVAPELPARTEQDLFCDLPPKQRALYDQLKAHYRSTLLAGRTRRAGDPGGGEIGGKERMQILVALLRLRQAACHGLLADGGADAALSGKLDELLPMLEEATSEGHRALVFSQFTRFLGCARERLDAAGIPYLYLDGKTRKREALTQRFQEGDGERVFLISLKAGGTGLNLTAADYVFLLDPWWNPAVERQAIDRAHRIGQTRPVVAYRLIAADTVEERILELQQEKRELAAAIIDGNASLAADLTRDDLERLLR